MHAIKTAYDEVIHHVNHRLGHRLIDVFKGIDAFLHQHVMHLQALLDHRHLVALATVQAGDLRGILNRHDAHAVSARIGFDDDKGIVLHAIFGIFQAHLLQDAIHLGCETFLADALLEIDLATSRKIGVNQPRINVQ